MHMLRQLMPGPVVEVADLTLGLQHHVRDPLLLHFSTNMSCYSVKVFPIFIQCFEEKTFLVSQPYCFWHAWFDCGGQF